MQSTSTSTMMENVVLKNESGQEGGMISSDHKVMSTAEVPSDKPTVTESPTVEDSGAAKEFSATTVALTMTSLCLSTLLSSLDLTIVTTAVPAIVASFKSTAGYIWIGSAFILGFTAVTPIWGSVADLLGRKPIILLALTIFLTGSLLCALSPNSMSKLPSIPIENDML